MEDFRNFNDQNPNNNGINRLPRDPATTPTPNEYGGIYDKPKQPKVGFFKARLNRDNFWNLMFWLGISLGVAMSEIFDSLLLLAFTLLALPKILTAFNKVTFTKEKIFLSSQGVSLHNNLPKKLNVILFFTIAITAFVFVPFVMLNGFILFHLTATTFIGFVISIPTLYFIFENCPISILFNKNSWCKKVIGISKINNLNSTHNSDIYTSPCYYNIPGNINYRRHHRN